MTTPADPAPARVTRDRLTKAPIYAAAGVPEYWIVNLRQEQFQEQLEMYRSPDPAARRYTVVEIARRGNQVALASLPDVIVAVTDLLP
jgi:Uma2 family endonuclease